MPRTSVRSITVPIVMGVVTLGLAIALMVGWTLLLLRDVDIPATAATLNSWLVAGAFASFAVIIMMITLFTFFLSREIREGQRQDRFIDSVTHELKSPLASLKLCVQTLNRHALSGAQREELHQMMLDDIDRLGAFIDDILQASRVGYEGEPAFARVRVADAAQAAAARVTERHHVDLGCVEIDVRPADLSLSTDPTALDVVLRNLLDNAIKYSDPPPRVRLCAEITPRGRVRVEVIDQGIGIPAEHLRHVFDRFYRVPEEAVHTRRGTGLGLYVASALARNLGGRLVATSAGIGKGTTMRLELPPGRRREDAPVDRPAHRSGSAP